MESRNEFCHFKFLFFVIFFFFFLSFICNSFPHTFNKDNYIETTKRTSFGWACDWWWCHDDDVIVPSTHNLKGRGLYKTFLPSIFFFFFLSFFIYILKVYSRSIISREKGHGGIIYNSREHIPVPPETDMEGIEKSDWIGNQKLRAGDVETRWGRSWWCCSITVYRNVYFG
jgi:hypothetical protein